MKVTHGNKKCELKYLYGMFKKLFDGKVDDILLTLICGKFSLYIYKDDQELLEDFVKEYFNMRKYIVDARNNSIDYLQSREYHESGLLTRRKAEKQLHKEQKMCEKINEFETEFYERTNISLLRVENERWTREQNKEKAIEQQGDI